MAGNFFGPNMTSLNQTQNVERLDTFFVFTKMKSHSCLITFLPLLSIYPNTLRNIPHPSQIQEGKVEGIGYKIHVTIIPVRVKIHLKLPA